MSGISQESDSLWEIDDCSLGVVEQSGALFNAEKRRAEGRQDASFVSSPSLEPKNEELLEKLFLQLHVDNNEKHNSNQPSCITPQKDNGEADSVETAMATDDDQVSCMFKECPTKKEAIKLAVKRKYTSNIPVQIHQGSRSQPIHAMESELQHTQHSKIVTSNTKYTENAIFSAGYNIGIQGQALPYSLFDVDRQKRFKPGSINPQASKSPSTSIVAMAGNSLPLFSGLGSSQEDPNLNTGSSGANNKMKIVLCLRLVILLWP